MRRASCLYEGVLLHRRVMPVRHSFQYRLFMLYLDLAELPQVLAGRWLWSAGGRAVAEFRRADYPGPPGQPLRDSICDLVERRLGLRPSGPIRLLTHLRYFGYAFNPVSFFYCFASDGLCLEAVVADVTNTPWRERHAYVVDARGESGGRLVAPKEFHVSPFMPMDLAHEFRFRPPGDRLLVGIDNRRHGEVVFSARLAMRRKEIDGAALARALLRFPWMTARLAAGVYGQAWVLHRKGAPYFEHPRVRGRTVEEVQP